MADPKIILFYCQERFISGVEPPYSACTVSPYKLTSWDTSLGEKNAPLASCGHERPVTVLRKQRCRDGQRQSLHLLQSTDMGRHKQADMITDNMTCTQYSEDEELRFEESHSASNQKSTAAN